MNYHFIGIKGTGMAALACILHDMHHNVTGSDIEKYIFTQDGLVERGIPFTTFDQKNIQGKDTVIIGAAFDETNEEVKAAMEDNTVHAIRYNDFLGEFLENFTSISVAGTHGKSTTTGILGQMLQRLGPTGYLIGDGHGYMPEDAKYFVLESCEFKRHFLAYHPDYAIVTNIELDHIDYYKDMDDYLDAFQSFVHNIRKKAIVYGDDPYLLKLDYQVPAVSYGIQPGNDYQAVNVEMGRFGLRFDVKYDGEIIAHLECTETGDPFLQDALGCFALAHEMGLDPENIAQGIESFTGIARRSVIEEVGESVLIDDYAHHPTAITYMIDMARKKYPDKKVIGIYKPDRFSRVQYFLDGFAKSLNTADQVVLCDFPKNAVREDETITVTIDDLCQRCPGSVLLDIDETSATKLKEMGPAVYLFMSSKDVYLLKDMLKKQLEENA